MMLIDVLHSVARGVRKLVDGRETKLLDIISNLQCYYPCSAEEERHSCLTATLRQKDSKRAPSLADVIAAPTSSR